MATKKKGLGRGLDALLGSSHQSDDSNSSVNSSDKRATLSIEDLSPGPYQPRSVFDKQAITVLADSIRQHGMIQPIVVRQSDTTTGTAAYEIIAGERRWRASQEAGILEVPVIIRDIDAQAALAIALIENIQREDLSAIEEAKALKRLNEEYQLTHEQVGQAVGRSRTAVSNLIRLLELDEIVQQAVLDKKIDMGHARALLPCDKALQIEIARQINFQGLTVRETEALVKSHLNGSIINKKSKSRKDPDVIDLENTLSAKLSTKVVIKSNDQGAGKLTISFNNLEILDGIISHIK